MLDDKIKKAITTLQNEYPEKRSALIPALHIAQAEIGYLPHEVQVEIAALFDIDVNEVHGVVTFYDMFYEKPQGTHVIHVCKNASCMLRGCDLLIENLCEKLDVQPGQTSKDGKWSVVCSECLGACDKAPMMLVDDVVVGPVEVKDLDRIIEEAEKSPGHPSPITADEVLT